jgi:hypothetical protein
MNDQIVKQNYNIDLLQASTPPGEDNAAYEPEYLIYLEHYSIWTAGQHQMIYGHLKNTNQCFH